jgi:hypothetical protein
MKKSWTSVTKVLLASALATGVGMFAGPVSAQPADLTADNTNASDALLLAWTKVGAKPPYKSDMAKQQQMEKGQFARFEEQPADAKDRDKSMSNGVQGNHPPFKRN